MAVSDSLLDRFAKRHSVDLRDLPDHECAGIRWFVRCTDALDGDYASLHQRVLANDPIVGVLWHLLARSAEQVEGAAVAFATGSGSSTEVICRAAIEASISIQFILEKPRPRLAAYFRHHVEAVDEHVRLWRSTAHQLSEPARAIHIAACKQREIVNQEMRLFVDRIDQELLQSEPAPKWPSFFDRCDALQDAITYRTVYARLCSEPHFNAEETLRYIIGRLNDSALLERMAIETISFTRLMLALAICYHLRAVGAYGVIFGMDNTVRECRNAVKAMDAIAASLSEHVG